MDAPAARATLMAALPRPPLHRFSEGPINKATEREVANDPSITAASSLDAGDAKHDLDGAHIFPRNFSTVCNCAHRSSSCSRCTTVFSREIQRRVKKATGTKICPQKDSSGCVTRKQHATVPPGNTRERVYSRTGLQRLCTHSVHYFHFEKFTDSPRSEDYAGSASVTARRRR